MAYEQLELEQPFRQLLWIAYNMRRAQIRFNSHSDYNNRKQVNYWQQKMDDALATMGINDQTDFKNNKITFENHGT